MNSETLDLEQAQLIHSHLDKFQGAISKNKGKPVSSQPTTGHLVTSLSSQPFSTQMSPGQPMYAQSMFTNSMQGQPMLGQPMQNQYSGKNMQGHVHIQNLPIPGIPIQSTGQSTFVQSSQGVGMPNRYTLTGATPQAFQQGMFQPNPMCLNMQLSVIGSTVIPIDTTCFTSIFHGCPWVGCRAATT